MYSHTGHGGLSKLVNIPGVVCMGSHTNTYTHSSLTVYVPMECVCVCVAGTAGCGRAPRVSTSECANASEFASKLFAMIAISRGRARVFVEWNFYVYTD